VDIRKDKAKLVSLLTNDMAMEVEDIIAIYRKEVGDRAFVQAAQAELPVEILLRRECQRHQDTDMGDTYRQPAAIGHTETHQKVVELLGPGDNV
jgi:hypothetical protein